MCEGLPHQIQITIMDNNSISSRDSSLSRGENKRQRQESGEQDQSGTICQKCDLLVAKAIDCAVCKLAFCLGCAKVSRTLFQCLMEGELDNFHWTCRSCKSMFPTIESISSTVKDIQKQHDHRMNKMEERMSKIETNTKQEIKSQVSDMKDQIIDSLKQDIHKVVDARSKELEDRKRRETNITIFNLIEHNHELGSDNKTADQQDVLRLSSELGLGDLNITTSYRLGKKIEGKNRPLKVVLDSKAQRKYLLENAKHIATKARSRFKQVIISKDLTVEQRKERRERIKQRKERNNRDQMGAGPDSGDEAAQGDAATMIVEEHEPSPIARDNAMSHLVADPNLSMNDTFSAFNNTTVIGEETIVGGFNTQGGRLKWPPPAAPRV